MEKPPRLWAAVVLAAVALLDRRGSWPGLPINANELGRLQAATALAGRATPEISVELDRLGRHEDFARVGDRVYSNKAPGLIFLWTPIVKVASAVIGEPTADNLGTHLWLARSLTVTAAWLLMIVPLARLVRRLGGDDSGAATLFLALTFASPAGLYAATGFAHAFGAALLVFVAERLFDVDSTASPSRWAAAGAAAALAFSSEYPLAFPAAVLFGAALLRERRWLGPAAAMAAGLVVLIPFFAYNAACFGGPLKLSTAFEGDPLYHELVQGGLFGIHWPRLEGARGLLISPSRGALVFSPWLLLAAAGWIGCRRPRWPFLIAAASLYVLMAGYPYWHGGWATGPRYLVAVIPLFGLGLIGLRFGRSLFALALGAGFALASLAAWTYPHMPVVVAFPASRQLAWAKNAAFQPTLLGSAWPWIQFAAAAGALALLVILATERRRFALALGSGILLVLALAAQLPAK